PLPPCPSPPINTVDDNTFDFFIPKDLLLTDLAPFFPFVVLDQDKYAPPAPDDELPPWTVALEAYHHMFHLSVWTILDADHEADWKYTEDLCAFATQHNDEAKRRGEEGKEWYRHVEDLFLDTQARIAKRWQSLLAVHGVRNVYIAKKRRQMHRNRDLRFKLDDDTLALLNTPEGDTSKPLPAAMGRFWPFQFPPPPPPPGMKDAPPPPDTYLYPYLKRANRFSLSFFQFKRQATDDEIFPFELPNTPRRTQCDDSENPDAWVAPPPPYLPDWLDERVRLPKYDENGNISRRGGAARES
ncbi:hypothetical protein JCM11641_006176, partial [Rhodosporidiobolus odoratus]